MNVLGAFIIVALIWGVVGIARFLFQLLAAPIATFAAHVAPFFSWFRPIVVDHLDGWVTGIATVSLAFFTFTLRAEAKRQGEKDRPFIAVGLVPDAQDGTWNEPYLFRPEDDVPALVALQAGQAPRFVRIRVMNEQTAVVGIATEIEIGLDLLYGATDNTSPYPHNLSRTVTVPVIGANKYVEGAVFNVAGLVNYTVLVRSLKYADVSGKTRQIGHGVGRVYQKVGGDPIYVTTVFGGKS